MRGKIISGALMTSLVLHIVIAIVAGLYLLAQTEQFKDLMGIEILYPKELPKPKMGKFVVKPVIKPTIPTRNAVIEQIQVQSRVETPFIREPTFQSEQVLRFSTQTVKVNPPTDPNLPKVITPNPAGLTDHSCATSCLNITSIGSLTTTKSIITST